tara:strand:+ start:486 stop:1805 length:1320 start_codon:yes stop_codon:yes gene_type:complete
MNKQNKNNRESIVNAGRIAFALQMIVLIPLNILLFTHGFNFHIQTNPCNAGMRIAEPKFTNNENFCAVTPKLLGYKSTSHLIANGLLGTVPANNPNKDKKNEYTNIYLIKAGIDIPDPYIVGNEIVTLCRWSSYSDCYEIDSCRAPELLDNEPKVDSDGYIEYKENEKINEFVDGLHGKDDECNYHKIPDVCLFTGFKKDHIDDIVHVSTVSGLGGVWFSGIAFILSTLHFLANTVADCCDNSCCKRGYCRCNCGDACIGCNYFPWCISSWCIENECLGCARKSKISSKDGEPTDACTQCGILTFLSLWTHAGFFFWTLMAQITIDDKCYGVDNAVLYGSGKKVALDFIKSNQNKDAFKHWDRYTQSFWAIVGLLIFHTIVFIASLILWILSKNNTTEPHEMTMGLSCKLLKYEPVAENTVQEDDKDDYKMNILRKFQY